MQRPRANPLSKIGIASPEMFARVYRNKGMVEFLQESLAVYRDVQSKALPKQPDNPLLPEAQ